MVWVRIGGSGRRGGYGRGYGRGYGGRYGGGYGRRPRGDDGSCLRDLLFLNTGCCLAQALGCGVQAVLLLPAALLLGLQGGGAESRAVRLVELYQRRISARRSHGCCRMTPTCSNYALGALRGHGTARGLRLTVSRLLRCRPGGPTGQDPVPAAR